MSNRQYDFTLAAVLGSSQRIDATGSKLKVLSSPAGPVGVKIDGGPELMLMEGQGFNMAPGKSFRDVVLRNLQATANAGTVFIGEEGFEDTRITGSVRVVDEITDAVTRGGLNPSTAVVAFLASPLVLPAANTRGMMVRGCSLNAQAGAGGSIAAALVACKSAPTGFNAPAQQFGFLGINEGAGVFVQKELPIINKLLPPGWGLYHLQAISTAAAAASGVVYFTEIL